LSTPQAVVTEQVDNINAETSAVWITLFSHLPRIAAASKAHLHPAHRLHARGFWKLSSLAHTCGASNITRPLAEDDSLALELARLLSAESSAASGFLEQVATVARDPLRLEAAAIFRSGVLARGLEIYDANVHGDVSKLPYLVVQQYVTPSVHLPSSRAHAGKLLGCFDEVYFSIFRYVSLLSSRTSRLL